MARWMLHTCAMRLFLCGALLAALASGCYATGSTSVGYSGTVTATTVAPDLVYVSPGVQVIADYDEPVFYTDGYYWREMNGTWYRSSYHTHGWAYAAPPRTVISIENRHSYRRYRPSGYTPRVRDHRTHDNRDWNRTRDHRDPGPAVRDHRTNDNRDWNRQPATRDHRDPGPATRDHRTQDPNWRQPATRDHRDPGPATRDHRTQDPNWRQPATRDHRDPGPATRDHRTPQPTHTRDNRDHRPAPTTRDNRDNKPTTRDNRDHRDNDTRDNRRRR